MLPSSPTHRSKGEAVVDQGAYKDGLSAEFDLPVTQIMSELTAYAPDKRLLCEQQQVVAARESDASKDANRLRGGSGTRGVSLARIDRARIGFSSYLSQHDRAWVPFCTSVRP